MQPPAARFDDLVEGRALSFPPPRRVIRATRAGEVRRAIAEVDAATWAGAWAYGFVGYEAARGLDPVLPVHEPAAEDPPLVWFAVTGAPEAVDPVGAGGGAYRMPAWELDRTFEQYRRDVEVVRERIAAGETYQVNVTARMRAAFEGEVAALYADLALRQRPAYAALIDTGTHVVASASPELFFSWSGDRLLTRPMKGTAARGRTPAEDRDARCRLRGSAKERAENLIVVDLLRNDLSRVAEIGTVRVERLGRAERYETVWQLTSDIAAEVSRSTSLVDVFTALFPSGSVTGAPKPRTMRIIRELEPGPRGVYCGAVGWVAPPDAEMRARFSVAIRTVVVCRESGAAVYGVGGGLTWASQAEAEWAEMQAKARILQPVAPAGDFRLIETMAFVPGQGIRHRREHLARLADSAGYFGFRFDYLAVERALERASGGEAARVRLTLARDGGVEVTAGPLPVAEGRPVMLAIDEEPVDSRQVWPYHKTTLRSPYETRARRHGSDDVVLVNERGHVTETTIANLAVRLEGRWWTPPISDGLLPGVERGRLIAAGILRERSLTVDDLVRADALAVVNSLRGWRPAVLG